MKKILFYAGLLALAVGCTDDTFETTGSGAEGKVKEKGITFVVSVPETKVQYEIGESTIKPFWFAEKDRLMVWASGFRKGLKDDSTLGEAWHVGSDSVVAMANGYSGTFKNGIGMGSANGDSVVYKATVSGTSGKFTAVDDANMLSYCESDTAGKVFALYAPTKKNSLKTKVGAEYSATQQDSIILKGLLNGLQTQAVTTTTGYTQNVPMWGYATGLKKENVYDAVGETMELTMKRATGMMVIKTENLKEKYLEPFGNLTQVKIKSLKNTASDGSVGGPYALAYTDNAATWKVDTARWIAEIDTVGNQVNDNNTAITVTIGEGTAGLKWNDSYAIPVAVADITKGGKADSLEITATFENIDLVTYKINSNDIKIGGMAGYKVDVEEKDWLVTRGTNGGNDRVLYVNRGELAGIFSTVTGKTDSINWKDSRAISTVNTKELKEIYIAADVTVTDDALKKLTKGASNVEFFQMNASGYTTLGQGTLKGMYKLKGVELTVIRDIADSTAFAHGAPLDSVMVPEYDCDNKDVAEVLLKADHLNYVKMATTSLNGKYPNNGIIMQNFKRLHKVDLTATSCNAGGSAFAGCDSLTEVNGLLVIKGNGVFSGDSVLTKVNISDGTNIKAETFRGCKHLPITGISVNDVAQTEKTFNPTTVGDYAFQKAAKVNFDLSNCTSIGVCAFDSAASLKGIKRQINGKTTNTEDVWVSATTIGDSAFQDCESLKFIYFKEATKIGNNMLNRTTPTEIKFGKVFEVSGYSNIKPGTFGGDGTTTTGPVTLSGTTLYYIAGQNGIVGNALTIGYGTNSSMTFTFGSSTDEERYE